MLAANSFSELNKAVEFKMIQLISGKDVLTADQEF
jgi:hypothetical protein